MTIPGIQTSSEDVPESLRLPLQIINVTVLPDDAGCPAPHFFTPFKSYPVKNSLFSRLPLAVLALAALLSISPAQAYDWGDGFDLSSKAGDRLNLIASPYTAHFHPSDEHEHVWLVGVERERADGALAGAAFFNNSFGQESGYLFPWGEIYRNVFDQPQMYVKWTAGLLYGYRGKYEHKVPFNHGGFSPAIVPALGWEFSSKQQIQLNLLGFNGLMLQFTQPLK